MIFKYINLFTMDVTADFKRIIFKFCFTILFCGVLLWFSMFIYGLLYYLYIPAIAHVKPIYFQYDAKCFKNDVCKFPSANLTLVNKGQYELLTRGQAYAVEVTLDMPESERNLNQGMFMIRLDMQSQNGETLQSSLRPALLHYKSSLFKIIYTFVFSLGLLAGTVEEKQLIIIPLFEQYEEDLYHPTHFVYIEIQAPSIEMYSSSLRIHAQFTGLRYFMYYWPVISAIIGVGVNFFFLSIIVLFIWLRQIMNTSLFQSTSTMTLKEQQHLTREIRKSVRKKRSEEPKSKSLGMSMKHDSLFNIQKKPEIEELSSHKELPFLRDGKSSATDVSCDTLLSESELPPFQIIEKSLCDEAYEEPHLDQEEYVSSMRKRISVETS